MSDIESDVEQAVNEQAQQLHWIVQLRYGRCPHCMEADLIAGPKAGGSRNVFCETCMTRWNVHGVAFDIIRVDDCGACAPADITAAREVYPNDQPFDINYKQGLRDAVDSFHEIIRDAIMEWLPNKTGMIMIAFNDKEIASLANVETAFELDILKRLVARIEGEDDKKKH